MCECLFEPLNPLVSFFFFLGGGGLMVYGKLKNLTTLYYGILYAGCFLMPTMSTTLRYIIVEMLKNKFSITLIRVLTSFLAS